MTVRTAPRLAARLAARGGARSRPAPPIRNAPNAPDDEGRPADPAQVEAEDPGELHVAEPHAAGLDQAAEEVEREERGRTDDAPAASAAQSSTPARQGEEQDERRPGRTAGRSRPGAAWCPGRSAASATDRGEVEERRQLGREAGPPATAAKAPPCRARRAGTGPRSACRSRGTGRAGSATTAPGCCRTGLIRPPQRGQRSAG